ncbi:hypothetical protein [Actinosynnema sp. ALI-1.44]|nr:hypothetical protein [Actinosynnema sp. ALI-1.44]
MLSIADAAWLEQDLGELRQAVGGSGIEWRLPAGHWRRRTRR